MVKWNPYTPELQLYYVVALLLIFLRTWQFLYQMTFPPEMYKNPFLHRSLLALSLDFFSFFPLLSLLLLSLEAYVLQWDRNWTWVLRIAWQTLQLAPVIGCLCNYLNQSKMKSHSSFSCYWWLNTPFQIWAFVSLLFCVLFFEIGSLCYLWVISLDQVFLCCLGCLGIPYVDQGSPKHTNILLLLPLQ